MAMGGGGATTDGRSTNNGAALITITDNATSIATSREQNMTAWRQLMTEVRVADAAASQWWQRLDALYSEPARAYHTHDHIADMLAQLRASSPPPNRSDLLRLAVFFHDAIYNPTSSTNEEDSAQLYRDFATEAGQPAADADEVAAWILATKAHAAPPGSSADQLLLVDLDLAVLGRPRHAYLRYAAQIREEYRHVPHADYCRGRARVLRSLADAPALYQTANFKSALEAPARENVAAEIAMLERGEVPGVNFNT